MSDTHAQKAKEIIQSVKYIVIATVDSNGQPWNTPVAAFRFVDDKAFYWASWTQNQHSQNIRNNGRAFITIFDSTPPQGVSDGVYIQAEACELNEEKSVMEVAKVFKDDPYNPSDGKFYLGESQRRIYKAIPNKIWINDYEEKDGVLIKDYRVELNTDLLIDNTRLGII